MSDITREEAIKILKDTLYDERTPNNYIQAVRMGREALENQKTGHWIPVSERLPEKYEEVIVTDIEISETYVTRYIGEGFWDRNRIIAWQPLPQPYKAESEDKE